MRTFTNEQREIYTKGVAVKDGRIHVPNQQYLMELASMPLPAGLDGIEEENVLDYFIANKDHVNGEIDMLLGKNGKPSRETYIKEMIPIIEARRKAAVVVPNSNNAQQATPATTPVAQIKKDSRGKKRLQTEIRTEFFRMIGLKESASANIYHAAVKHFDTHLKDVANMVSTVAGIEVAEERDALVGFTVKTVFGKIFGAIPGSETVIKPIIVGSPLLIYRYEAILFKDGSTSSDESIKNAFRSKVINAAAVKIAEALEEPVEDIVAELLPIWEENLESIKKEFSAEQ